MDIFCKIVAGEIPSHVIYEDELVKVILDVNPKHNGHSLIIPKKHYLNLFDIDQETINYIMMLSKKIALLLKEKLQYDGITIVLNNGLQQEVKHFHLHLIPKYINEEKISVEEIYQKLKN